MTNDKLFEKLGALLETRGDADKKHIKKLRKVLQKLKKSQKELYVSLDEIDDEHERRKIKQDIEVLKLQRQKGVKVYKELKQAQATAQSDLQ
jgi:translation elongation factor EF-1alpha